MFIQNQVPQNVSRYTNVNLVIIAIQLEYKLTSNPPATCRLALEMYLEGMGFRQIGRILRISHITIYKWIKKWGSVHLPRTSVPVKVVELDELHTHVSVKKL